MVEKYLKPSITIVYGFIGLIKTGNKIYSSNIESILGLQELSIANGYIFSPNLIKKLFKLNSLDMQNLTLSYAKLFKSNMIQFKRIKFATNDNILEEAFTIDEAIDMLMEYFVRYELDIVDFSLHDIHMNDKVVSGAKVNKEKLKKLNSNIKIIDVKNEEEIKSIIDEIIKTPINLNMSKLDLIYESHRHFDITSNFHSFDFKNKNNIFEIAKRTNNNFLKHIIKTANDVLRYAYYCSNLNFLEKSKFKLKTSEKNIIMSSLSLLANNDETVLISDIKPRKNKWLGLAKALYPNSSKFKKYKNAQKIFKIIREEKMISFGTISDDFVKTKNFIGLARYLSKKPGILIRSLDFIMRNINGTQLNDLGKILNSIKLNPKLGIQIIKHLEARNKPTEKRFVYIKNKIFEIEKERALISNITIEYINKILLCKVSSSLKGKKLIENINKVRLEENLKDVYIPFKNENSSIFEQGFLTPGSRKQIPKEAKNIRLFIAWKSKNIKDEYLKYLGKNNHSKELFENFIHNTKALKYTDTTDLIFKSMDELDYSPVSSNDLDLSCAFAGADKSININYSNMSSKTITHSGDFTSSKKVDKNSNSLTGEFIDFNIKDTALIYDSVMTLTNQFQGNDFNNIDAWYGIQLLDDDRCANSNIIDITKSLFKAKITGDFKSCFGIGIDFKTNEIILIDQYNSSLNGMSINSMSKEVDLIRERYFNIHKYLFSAYEILTMYCTENDIEISDDANYICGIEGDFSIAKKMDDIINMIE